MKTRKQKPRTNEWYRKKCCEIAKKIARLKTNNICEYCGSKDRQTHGSHIYSAGLYKNMSVDVDNILSLCWLCHMGGLYNVRTDKRFSWHGTPLEAMEWFMKKYPERYQKLKLRTQKIYKVNFEKKREELKKQLAELEK